MVKCANFDRSGVRVVTGSTDGTARIWDVKTGRSIFSLVHPKAVHMAKFSPDGTRVVTASDDGGTRIWDAETGKPIGELLSHTKSVVDVAFSPDGMRAVTASADGTARIWNVAESGPLPAWIGDATACTEPEAGAAGSSRTCPLASHAITSWDLLARVLAVIATADAKLFSREWALPRADYGRALALLDASSEHVSRRDQDEAEQLRGAILIRLAVLDGFEGRLVDARAHLALDHSIADAQLLAVLAGIAHDALTNDIIALELLLRARKLDPKDISILGDFAEIAFVSGHDEDLARTLRDIAGLKASPDVRLAMATLAWAAAYLHEHGDQVLRTRLLDTYRQIERGSASKWSWTGTKHALAYGRFYGKGVHAVLDVISLLEKPASNENSAALAELLLHAHERR